MRRMRCAYNRCRRGVLIILVGQYNPSRMSSPMSIKEEKAFSMCNVDNYAESFSSYL